MGKAIATTDEKMTDGQPTRIAVRLVPYFRKEGADLPKDAVQTVLDREMEPLLKEMFEVFRRRVDVKLALAPRGTFTISLSERHDPDSYYRDRQGSRERPGLSVLSSLSNIVTNAKPTEIGTTFIVTSFDAKEGLNDEDIEGGLPDSYLFDDTQVCAVIASLITTLPHRLTTNPCQNLFYTRSGVVNVSWSCTAHVWHVMEKSGRDDRKHLFSRRVFCLIPNAKSVSA